VTTKAAAYCFLPSITALKFLSKLWWVEGDHPMLFVTRWFGVTGSDSERDLAREKSEIEQIMERSLLMQANAAAKQHRPLACGTHAKGVCARAQFEVFDVTAGRDRELAARLAKGMFAKPGVYPSIVRFGNADPNKNSDFKADVRSALRLIGIYTDQQAESTSPAPPLSLVPLVGIR
jgi:hypothetical protein